MQPLRKDPILRRMNVCVNFTGIQNDECRVGIRYDTVRRAKTESTPYQFACFQDEAHGLTCEKVHWKTHEEAETEERETAEMWARVSKASKAAHDDAKLKRFGKGQGGADSLLCPVCSTGRLYYRVSSYNGPMHAQCETEGCVSWME